MHYDAMITREGKNYLIEFPDCPGCQTFAESEGEVLSTAQGGDWEFRGIRKPIPPQP